METQWNIVFSSIWTFPTDALNPKSTHFWKSDKYIQTYLQKNGFVQFLLKEAIYSVKFPYSKLPSLNKSFEISEIVFSNFAIVLSLHKMQKNMANWLF